MYPIRVSKIIDHPVTKLKKQVSELEKKLRDMEVDQSVLKDLLMRTIKIVQKLDKERERLRAIKKV